MIFMKKRNRIGSKGNRLKNKSGWGGCRGEGLPQVLMDINKNKMNPNKGCCLWKNKGIVGSKGSRFKNKNGWGGATYHERTT